MKVAVTYENGEVFQHFGQTEQFKIYQIENGRVASSDVVGTNGNGHGALAVFLRDLGVEKLICGGIGGGARSSLSAAGVAVFPGVNGSADSAVESFLGGSLIYNPDTQCSHHHEDGHHECHHDGGTCGH